MEANQMMYVFFFINTIFISLLCVLFLVITIFTYRIFKKMEKAIDSLKQATVKATGAFEDVTGTVKTESQDIVAGVSRLIQKVLPKK